MMLACPGLRVVPVTVHQSLAEAVRSLTTEAIVAVAELTAAALERDFGIAKPHLSVAALTPHAGEGGSMGREEGAIIAPPVSRLKKRAIGTASGRERIGQDGYIPVAAVILNNKNQSIITDDQH